MNTTNGYQAKRPSSSTASGTALSSSSTATASTDLYYFNHAVSRSNELISCCKTAWKIQVQKDQKELKEEHRRKQQLQQPGMPPPPPPPPPPPMPNMRLASTADPPPASLVVLEDGLTLLRSMEYGLRQLQGLVRRRGHTNDPTQEIATLVQQLEQDTAELTEFCEQQLALAKRKGQMKRPGSGLLARNQQQEQKHWEYIVQWFQQVANHYSKQLKECLEVRGNVLQQQAQQRKKITTTTSKTGSSSTTATANKHKTRMSAGASHKAVLDSPLFSAPAPRKSATSKKKTPVTAPAADNPYARSSNTTATTNGGGTNGTGVPSYYTGGGYGGAPPAAFGSGGGYGGGGTNLRQRKGGGDYQGAQYYQQQQQQNNGDANNDDDEHQKVHSKIQQRKQQRQTQRRLEDARQAETKLGELMHMFGKMSTLISTQGEVLEKIEDDVEAAYTDVAAGQEELTNLYAIKKGNRPLIIKTFAILIFLIIFMRAYKN